MLIRNVAAASALALALCACGSRNETTTVNEAGTITNSETSTATPSASPGQTFANAAAASDAFEIESSKLALSISKSAQVKRFAQSMIDAHTQSTAKLNAAGTEASVTPDPALNAEQTAKLEELRGKSGTEFDAAYIEAQQAGHRRALETLKRYSASGEAVPLKRVATELIPIVTAHLNMAGGLRR